MKPYDSKKNEGGSRLAIILSGSPLFSGQAGSGESDIRRWIIENDWVEGIVAMPDQMFYNTGIGTYIWILTNRKNEKSKGKIRLIDARDFGTKVRKSLGDKRKEITIQSIDVITNLYSDALNSKNDKKIKIMLNEEFGFARITVERPLRRVWRLDEESIENSHPSIREKLLHLDYQIFNDENEAKIFLEALGFNPKEIAISLKSISKTDELAEPIIGKKGKIEADPELREFETIELPIGFIQKNDAEKKSILEKKAEDYLHDEIHPYFHDAWIDHSKTKIGFEIPFTRQFFSYSPPRNVKEIRDEIEQIETEIQSLIRNLW
jgi:type I restriction enzyme M protein